MAGEGKGKRAPGADRAEAAGWPAWVVSEVAHGNLVEREWKGVSVLVGTLPLCRIEPNDGQIDGLPSNPREWTQEEFNDLRQSIIDTPELFVGRGCLVVPWGGGFRCNPRREYALLRVGRPRGGARPGRPLSPGYIH